MLAVATLCALSMTESPVARPPDDATIYAAILRHTIRPTAKHLLRDLPDDELPFVIVHDSTFAVCDTSGIDDGLCIREVAFKWLDALLSGRDYLVQEFRQANAMRHSIVGLEVEGAIIVAADRIQDVQSAQVGRIRGHAGFSRPVYTRSGHAIVYAAYYCGAACGNGWLFLLDSNSGPWRVTSVESVWIS